MLVPPANFGIAEEGIYRCSKVETLNLSFLETLNLKSIIFMGGQGPSKFFKEFFNNSNMKWHIVRNVDFSTTSTPVTNKISSSSKESDNLGEYINFNAKDNSNASQYEGSYQLNDTDELMLIKSKSLKTIFSLLLNTENYNILLVDRTGIIVGILRKLQKWNIASIINEYRLFAGKNVNYFAETFLEIIKLSIEQEIDDGMITERIMQLKLEKEKQEKAVKFVNEENYKREKSISLELVCEDDLLEAPEVPSRVLQIVGEAEAENQNRLSLKDPELIEEKDKNLGIFGNQYRLAFNKKERGEYEYYNCSKNCKSDENVVTIKIPIESKLPSWFKFQRNLWEQKNVIEDHNFYAENIFV